MGAPGAGKTTLLNFLARRAAQNPGIIPFLIPCREYAIELTHQPSLPLQQFALNRLAAENSPMRQELDAAIDGGQALWLVDALDEGRGWAGRIAHEARQLPGKLICTSRPFGYSGAGLETLPHYEILPL